MRKWIVALGALVAVVVTASTASAGGLTPTRYLNHNGVRLAVYESSGTESPGVLLLHGNTSSASSYAEVLASPFARRQHVVAVDFAGYGNSDNAPAYDVASFAGQIAFVAQATGVADGVVVGWSLGGDLALQASHLLPNAAGYFLFGTAPLGQAPGLPAPFLSSTESYAGAAVNYGFIPNLTTQQVDDYVTAFFRPGYRRIPSFFFDDGRRTDPATRAAVGIAGAGLDPTFRDEVAIARNLTVPLALVLGTEDAFVNPAYLSALAPSIPQLYEGEVISVRNAGHAIHWEHDARFTALLSRFVRDTRHCH
jgi:pimeloyl-ACP methyl ester carboxylesterase